MRPLWAHLRFSSRSARAAPCCLRVIPALGSGAAGGTPRAGALPQVRLAVLERHLRVLESPAHEALAAELLLDLVYMPAAVAASIRSGMSRSCKRVQGVGGKYASSRRAHESI
jgi:hypothetical protein